MARRFKVTNVSHKLEDGKRNVFLTEMGTRLEPGQSTITDQVDPGTRLLEKHGVLKIEEGAWQIDAFPPIVREENVLEVEQTPEEVDEEVDKKLDQVADEMDKAVKDKVKTEGPSTPPKPISEVGVKDKSSAKNLEDEMTKEELMEEASKLDIDGRSSMSKSELAKAVSKKKKKG